MKKRKLQSVQRRKPPENLEVQATVKSGGRGGRPILQFKKVAHTISPDVASELREVAHAAWASESAVIEFALEQLFERGRTETVKIVKAAGATQRRKRG